MTSLSSLFHAIQWRKLLQRSLEMIYKFTKFILVGVLNTIFGYLLFATFLYVGMHYSLAALLGTILGILFNFKTTGGLVFRNKNNLLIFKFVGVYSINYVVSVAVLSIFNHFRFNLYIAGLLMLLPMALLSFVLNSKFVFGENICNAAD